MKMIRYCLIFALVISQASFAQKRQGHEKIRALKTAHITQQLNLSPAEAESFWPVYNEFQEQLEKLRRQERSELSVIHDRDMGNLTEAEANRILDNITSFKIKEASVHRDRVLALRKVIGPQKVLKLQKAEEDFKRLLLNRFRGRRGPQ